MIYQNSHLSTSKPGCHWLLVYGSLPHSIFWDLLHFTSSRITVCRAQLLPTSAFLLEWLPREWRTRLRCNHLMFLPQIRMLILGKRINSKINMGQEDAAPQWRWPSEPSGERPPSTGMELLPFSKRKPALTMRSQVLEMLGFKSLVQEEDI